MQLVRLIPLLCAVAPGVAFAADPNPFESGQDQVLAAETDLLTEQAAAAEPFRLNLYGDVGAGAQSGPGQHPGFGVGAVDLFATADLSDSIRVLSEDVLEVVDTGAKFELERLHVDFMLHPWFNVRLGREHIPIGFFSQNYHHAHVFMLSATRPTMFNYEDEGGILPAHVVGASVFGEGGLGESLSLHYVVGLSNGRGGTAADVQSTGDRDLSKAVYGRLSLHPRAVTGMEFGASVYLDTLRPADAAPSGTGGSASPALYDRATETMLGGHLAYQGYPVDAIFEFFHIGHNLHRPAMNLAWNALTAQVGVEFLEYLTPYARFDYIHGSRGDPFFVTASTVTETSKATLGLRFRLDPKATLKIEGSRDTKNDVNAAILEAAFGL